MNDASPSTIGDRLYKDAHKFARRKREMAEAAKRQAEQEELKECTFKPKISEFAKELRTEFKCTFVYCSVGDLLLLKSSI